MIRKVLPRLPLDGRLDLTYRCNNTCRHCWLKLAANATEIREELSFDELRDIVDEARAMGCQGWSISGGEPMLRPDFAEIFDYITRKSVHYSLNTNGTLITPGIARLLTRKGRKMVALYGATAEVHDQVTRNPGSFEATMSGFAYLKEAGAGFIVQIVPMRANYHQYDEMLALARSLSPHYRIGASWLWLSACGSNARNQEIARQRLEPAEGVALDAPYPVIELADSPAADRSDAEDSSCIAQQADDFLFAACIAARRDFHIDPYGKMTFCFYIKDPALRYDLRQGTFQQAWDEFIPSLAGIVRGGQEYQENCGVCEQRRDCRWCGVYAYLEHGRYSARVDYLCRVAAETRRFKEDWRLNHIRYFQIAGLTIRVIADQPLTEDTYSPALHAFQVDDPAADMITIHLHSQVPARSEYSLGKTIYQTPQWAIYKQGHSWVYLGAPPKDQNADPPILAIFDKNHNRGDIYRQIESSQMVNLHSLTTFPSDQILLARILADRQACIIHASGFVLDGQGLLFVGHSEAGKSTMMKMLRGHGQILCDDRIIVRRWPDGFRIHGTWSHGELLDVSPASAPLRAILFLEKANDNQLDPISNKQAQLARLLSHVVKPLATADWWEKILPLIGQISAEVPTYRMQFDRSGEIVPLLKQLASNINLQGPKHH